MESPPVIPGHTLLRQIGQGAYGEVWLAREDGGEWRAVKVVRRAAFESDRPFDREWRGLEKSVAAMGQHSGLVAIHSVGQNPGTPTEAAWFHYSMDLADDAEIGRDFSTQTYQPHTLHGKLETRGRLLAMEAVTAALQLAEALAHLHAQGLVHRDVKPANVIYVNDQPQLADLGLVSDEASALSQVGTPGYVPPEGVGRPAGDVYALGLVLYEMATGRDRMEFPDFPSEMLDDAGTTCLAAVNEVVMRACSPNPAERYETAADMAADLKRLVAGKALRRHTPAQTRRRARAAALVALAGIGLAVWLALSWRGGSPPAYSWERGLVAHYAFDGEASGVSALLGADRHGDANSALRFINGKPTNYFTGHALDLPGTNLTVGLWFKPNILNYERALVAQEWARGGAFQMTLREGRLTGRFRGVDGILTLTGPPASRHAWQHAAWTYDVSSGRATVYHNGLPVANANTTGPLPPVNAALTAGRDGTIGYVGLMDEIRVFNRALSIAEIAQWFAHEKPYPKQMKPVQWDFEYAYQDVFEPHADRYVHATNRVCKYREPDENNVTYWGPVQSGNNVGGELIYRFPFPRPTRKLFLYTTLHTWDLANLGLGKGQGTGSLQASRDGTNWITLHDLTRPKARYGEMIEHSDLLPPNLTGGRELFLKMTMSVHGARPSRDFSPAHHNQNDSRRRENNHNVFELKARLK